MSYSRVFVSGVAGFLGSHIADMLIKKNYTVVGCDNLSGGDKSNVPSKTQFFNYDCSDLQKNIMSTKKVDIVVHAAAAAYEGYSVFCPNYVTQNILNNTISLLTAAIRNGVKRFIYFSSMSRYGENELPFREDLTPRPLTPYGIAKFASEQMVKQLCTTHGLEYVICVPHNIVGARQKYDDPFRNVAAIMANRMLQGLQPIIYGNGEQKRCFSDVRDTLQVFEQLITEDKACGKIINIGPDEEFITINKLAQEIAQQINFDLKPIYVSKRPNEVFHATCSSDLARKEFGYKTQYKLTETLQQIIDWIQLKGVKDFDYHILPEIEKNLPLTWRDKLF